MITELGEGTVFVWDIDDTLFKRQQYVRSLGVIAARFRPSHPYTLTLEDLPEINNETVDIPLASMFERISFRLHAQRSLLPGVRETLEFADSRGIDNIGNTGRVNTREWADMTWESFQSAAIAPYFQGIFFTPQGVSTAESKAVRINGILKSQQYQQLLVFEDDPKTIAVLSQLFSGFSGFNICLVRNWSTGFLYPERQLARLPNVVEMPYVLDIIRRTRSCN